MITTIIVNLVLVSIAVFLIGLVWFVLTRRGNYERAAKSAYQSIRWFMVAAVFATIDDVLVNGALSEIILPAAVSLAILTSFEYWLKYEEGKIVQGKSSNPDMTTSKS